MVFGLHLKFQWLYGKLYRTTPERPLKMMTVSRFSFCGVVQGIVQGPPGQACTDECFRLLLVRWVVRGLSRLVDRFSSVTNNSICFGNPAPPETHTTESHPRPFLPTRPSVRREPVTPSFKTSQWSPPRPQEPCTSHSSRDTLRASKGEVPATRTGVLPTLHIDSPGPPCRVRAAPIMD